MTVSHRVPSVSGHAAPSVSRTVSVPHVSRRDTGAGTRSGARGLDAGSDSDRVPDTVGHGRTDTVGEGIK
jgi:hypothetical protein